MESLSYHPNANARALAQQSTETIGLVVGDVSDPFFGAMVKAVEQVAYNTGNFLLIGNGYHNEQKERQAIEQLIRHRCAALVVHAKIIPDAELASLMKQIPGMVLINRILPGFEQRCVALDDRFGAGSRPDTSFNKAIRALAICAPITRFQMRKIVCKAITTRWQRAIFLSAIAW